MFLRRSRPPVSRRRRALLLAGGAPLFLALYLGARAWLQRDMLHGPLPDLHATDLDGRPVSLADYRGRPWLLHVWASWCRICRFERGAVASVARDWPVLTVAMQSGDADKVRAFLEVHGLRWRTVVDESGALAQRLGVSAVPAFYVVDGAGRVRFREMGYTTAWGLRLRLWLARLLE